MLYRRGIVAPLPCRHCVLGNSRFELYVYLPPVTDFVFPTEHFNGACANCLPGETHRYTIGSHRNEFALTLE